MLRKFCIVFLTFWLTPSAQTDFVKSETNKADYFQSVQEPGIFFRAGDAIKISVYPDTTFFLNGFYHIDNNFYIDLPMLGLVSVKDKTRNQFIEFLKKQYGDYLRYPNISVTSYIRVSFFGGFYKPGLYWVENRSSLWDAMQIAGGVGRDDGLKKVRWERDGTIISYNIIKSFQSGNSLESIGFKSGDQLCVTSRPNQQFWESFSSDVVPVLSITLTALTTALTAYQTYKVFYNK